MNNEELIVMLKATLEHAPYPEPHSCQTCLLRIMCQNIVDEAERAKCNDTVPAAVNL